MGPIKLMSAIFVLNVAAITATISVVKPSQAQNLELHSVSIQKPKNESPRLISGKPARLEIKNAGIDLKVIDGSYNSQSGEWTLSDDKAHYALITPEPNNQVGNTFIYGHNNPNVFKSLETLAVGNKAAVYTSNNKRFIYRLSSIEEVVPTDVSLFEYKGSSRLTIQTCSGNWYEKRKLFIFDFLEVENK